MLHFFLANWTSIYTSIRHMYYSSSTNPKTHLLAKRIFHVVFFHFQTKKAQRIVGSPVSKRIWVCLYRCFKDLKQDKFKFYYKSKFLLHSSQGRYHFFIFWKINESAYLFIIFFSAPNERIENSYLQNTNTFAKTLSPFL